MQPEEALAYYNIEGVVKSITPFGLGHINDTYRVDMADRSLLLQKINSTIFRNPEVLESNLKVILSQGTDILSEHLKSKSGAYHLIKGNHVWRLQGYVEGSYSPNSVRSIEMAYQIGNGFGQFTKQMSALSASEVGEAIPQFHHLGLRIEKFDGAVKANKLDRNQRAEELINKAYHYAWIWDEFQSLISDGLPQRVCHNDTKSTNILLERDTDQFLKVIDLDTVGPGYVLFEFGDMVRSMATQAHEGDPNALEFELQTELIKANKEGYLGACGDLLTEAEVSSLDFGALFMTYFTGIRMLTDYLEGDVYYRIEHENDNLIRSRNQFYVLDLLNDYPKNES